MSNTIESLIVERERAAYRNGYDAAMALVRKALDGVMPAGAGTADSAAVVTGSHEIATPKVPLPGRVAHMRRINERRQASKATKVAPKPLAIKGVPPSAIKVAEFLRDHGPASHGQITLGIKMPSGSVGSGLHHLKAQGIVVQENGHGSAYRLADVA